MGLPFAVFIRQSYMQVIDALRMVQVLPDSDNTKLTTHN